MEVLWELIAPLNPCLFVIKRTIEISREPATLSVQLDQLLLKRNGETVGSIPCEDIGFVVTDNQQTMYTHSALVRLAESDAAVVVCGRNHLPVAILLPLADHSQVVWRLKEQLAAPKPVRKQIWKQLIQAKLRAQAENLPPGSPARTKIIGLVQNVRSGDPSNVEAHAARVYWGNWMPEQSFRREAEADGLNALLNYGYAIIRAALARAIVAAGYHPSLGLKHSNRSNVFCLADDLIEPLRPIVDARAADLYRHGSITLDQKCKAGLLQLLSDNVWFAGEYGPMMVSLHRFVASLAKCFRGESKRLEIPTTCK